MKELVFLFVGAVGLFMTASILVGLINDTVGALLGVIVWTIFSFGATNIEQYSQCCVTRTSEPGLMYLGIAMVFLMVVIMVFSVVESVGDQDPDESRSGFNAR